MAKTKGLLLDNNGDLLITNGNLSIGDVTYQNIYLLLASHKGEFKEHPLLGAGTGDMVGDNDIAKWKYIIRTELSADGMIVTKLDIANGEILVNAKYK